MLHGKTVATTARAFLVLLIAFQFVLVALPGFSDANSKKLLVIFLRGSGQNGGDFFSGQQGVFKGSELRDGEHQSRAFFESLNKKITGYDKEFVSFHNQGGHAYGYAARPAESIAQKATHNTATTIRSNAYLESVYDGSDALTQYIRAKVKEDPNRKIILGGYSQGAHVVGDALPRLTAAEREKIAYVALYGDPKMNTKDDTSLWKKGPWVRGSTSIFANGSLGARVTYMPEDMRYKVGSWCDVLDAICASRTVLSNPIGIALADKFIARTHSNTYQDKWIPQSMNEVAGKLDSSLASGTFSTQVLYRKNGTRPYTDIVLVLDTAGSNDKGIAALRANSAKIANALIKDKNTQVAIVRYSNQTPGLFGSTPTLAWLAQYETNQAWQLERYLAGIGTDDPRGAGAYTPLYSGLNVANTTMKRMARPGAQKQYIVYTNKIPGGAFATGAYVHPKTIPAAEVLRTMYLLDPVVMNAIVVPDNVSGSADALSWMTQLATSTNGSAVKATDATLGDVFASTADSFDTSPVVVIGEPEYDGFTVYLSGGESYDPNGYIQTYRWDCTDDGIYEIEDVQPSVACRYDSPYNGLVGLEVVASDGQSAKMYREVLVSGTAIGTVPSAPVVTASLEEGGVRFAIAKAGEDTTMVLNEQGDVIAATDATDWFVVNEDIDGTQYGFASMNDFGMSDVVWVGVPKPTVVEPDQPTPPPIEPDPAPTPDTSIDNPETEAVSVKTTQGAGESDPLGSMITQTTPAPGLIATTSVVRVNGTIAANSEDQPSVTSQPPNNPPGLADASAKPSTDPPTTQVLGEKTSTNTTPKSYLILFAAIATITLTVGILWWSRRAAKSE